MYPATDIYILPLTGKPTSFLLIAVLASRGRAYYSVISNRFPTEQDVEMCLRVGTGLSEGGEKSIDALLSDVRSRFQTERHWEDSIINAMPR